VYGTSTPFLRNHTVTSSSDADELESCKLNVTEVRPSAANSIREAGVEIEVCRDEDVLLNVIAVGVLAVAD